MPTNPYSSPAELSDHAPPSRSPSKAEAWFARVACGVLFVFAWIYLPAMTFDPPGAITLTSMLELSSATETISFKALYTTALLASPIAYYLDRPRIAFVASLLIATLTIWALVVSSVANPNASKLWYWTHVRFGETATAVVAILMLFGLARRVFWSRFVV